MPNRNQNNSTNYVHPNESNLWELHKAMSYNSYGQPTIRTVSRRDISATEVTAFGEPVAVPITPVIQLDGLYGLQTKNFETFSAGTGSVAADPLMTCSTGTGIGGYGVIRSRRAVRYRPGQGALTRFTAAFTAGTAGYTQRAGFFAQEQAVQVGFDGVDFGILRQNQGKTHIGTVEITAGASSTGNITLTLDDNVYVIPITDNTADTGITAAEISEWLQANAADKWVVEHCVGFVHFLSTSVGPKTGTFSFVDTDATGITASIDTDQNGVNDVNTWTYQNDFNIDKLDGTGPSGVTLDPTKLNVYQINFRWLGAGELRFAVEDPNNGEMIFFHHIHYTNRNNTVHLDNPSLKIGYVAASLGGTGTDIQVSGASMLGAVEGNILTTTLPTSAYRLSEFSPNIAADTLYHGLTVHNRLIFADKINTRELLIKEVSVVVTPATGQDHPVEVVLFFNFNGLPSPSVYKVINETQSSAFYNDTQGSLVEDANIPVYSFFITAPGSQTINLDDLRLAIPPNNDITVAIKSTAALDGLGVGLTFVED